MGEDKKELRHSRVFNGSMTVTEVFTVCVFVFGVGGSWAMQLNADVKAEEHSVRIEEQHNKDIKRIETAVKEIKDNAKEAAKEVRGELKELNRTLIKILNKR